MPIAVREEFERISGVRVLNSYGMTENASSIAIDPRDGPTKEGSSGIRLPYTDVRAVELDQHQKEIRQCGPEEIGMLVIRSPGLTPGYLNPEHNVKSWTQDGWLITGDLGRIDDDGYVFVTGRLKDVIIRGGHNIDPGLIEEALVQSKDVLLVAAVGKPDAYAGELPIAYVQLAQDSKATSADLLQFLESRISERAAIPKEIHILEKMPLTDIGKPMKVKLREMTIVREFTRLIEDVINKLKINHQDSIEIMISNDTARGTLIQIKLGRVDQSKQDLIHTQIHQLMGQFAYAYEII
jgi:fatty-acyl-CoA synthase